MNRPKEFVFDARSASTTRVTGWERCAKGLAQQFLECEEIAVRFGHGKTTTAFLFDGEFNLPKIVGASRLVHFPTFPPTAKVLEVAERSGTPLVWTLHDLTWWQDPDSASFLGRHYYAKLAQHAIPKCHLIAPSEATKQAAMKQFGLSANEVSVISNGISPIFAKLDLPASSPRQQVSDGQAVRPYFLFVGTMEPRKNLRRLLKAFEISQLSRTHDLWLVGRRGWGEVPRGAIVKGVLNDEELVDAYVGAVTTLQLSTDEGFGLPVYESLACQTPVIASDIAVFQDIRTQLASTDATKSDLTLVDPFDVDSIADVLKDRATSPITASTTASRWAQGFTWGASAEQHRILYAKLAPN